MKNNNTMRSESGSRCCLLARVSPHEWQGHERHVNNCALPAEIYVYIIVNKSSMANFLLSQNITVQNKCMQNILLSISTNKLLIMITRFLIDKIMRKLHENRRKIKSVKYNWIIFRKSNFWWVCKYRNND